MKYFFIAMHCFLLQSTYVVGQLEKLERYNTLPLKPTRTLSFSTDEGTAMHVDISPDGKQIVFTLVGEIFIMPSTGGTAKQLTRGMAVNSHPVWSPDGKYIAFTSDRSGVYGLHLMTREGEYVRMLGMYDELYIDGIFDAFWTPDAQAIAAGGYLYSLTGNKIKLPDEFQTVNGFSADGQFVYASISTGDFGWKISKYDRFSNEKSTLAFPTTIKTFSNPRVSPDGHWLTFLTGSTWGSMDSLMICDLQDTNKIKRDTNLSERLLRMLNVKYSGPAHNLRYGFSFDSKYLLIGYNGKIHRIDMLTGQDDIIPFEAQVNFDMASLNYNTFPVSLDSFHVNYTRYAHRNNEGDQLVFQALNRIYIQKLPQGVPRILVNQPFGQFQPSYSPDSKWIIYTSWQDTIGGHVWMVPASGGRPKQVTKVPARYHQPSISPDRKMVMVIMSDADASETNFVRTGELQLIEIASGEVKVIGKKVPVFNRPMFSSNGEKVFFKPNIGNGSLEPLLVSKNLKNENLTVLAKGIISEEVISPIRQIVRSPDDCYIVFTCGESLFLCVTANPGFPPSILTPGAQLPVIRVAESGIDPHWENGGKVLSWSFGNKYFSSSVKKIIAAAIDSANSRTFDTYKQNFTPVSITPDSIISIDFKVAHTFGKGTIALKNVRVITMDTEKVIEKGTVIIRDGRIIAVGSSNEIRIPPRATVLNLNGKTVMPGLVDMHAHIGGPKEIIPGQYPHYLANLAYGVTTSRDVSASHDKFAYQELLKTGQLIGPRLFTVGSAIRPDVYAITDASEAALIVEGRSQMGATLIKHYKQPARIQQQWLAIAAQAYGINMTNEGAGILLNNLGMIKDGSTCIEHNPDFGETYKDVISVFSQSGSFLCPTIQVSYSRLPHYPPMNYFRKNYMSRSDSKYEFFSNHADYLTTFEAVENPEYQFGTPNFIPESNVDARISKAGGRILVGSHGEDQGIGLHFELWALQMGGISNLEALRLATIVGAEGIGVQHDIGSIKVGKIADLLVLDKNPIEDIHNTLSITHVMKGGILYEANLLNQVWPKRVKLPSWKIRKK